MTRPIQGMITRALLGLLLAAPLSADILYSVREGDTLATIAKTYGVAQDEIQRANPGLGEVTPGLVLVLPEKVAPLEQAAPAIPSLTTNVDQGPPPANRVAVLTEQELAAQRRRREMSSRRGRLLRGVTSTAKRFIGVPYRMGGTTSRAFDCSGFTQAVYRMNGIKLPRTADVQYLEGKKVPKGKEAPGDLVFFETYLPGASHCGIYLGNRSFIHASSSRGVTIDSLDTAYYKARYLGAKRVF